jgi:hypothetical protein
MGSGSFKDEVEQRTTQYDDRDVEASYSEEQRRGQNPSQCAGVV